MSWLSSQGSSPPIVKVTPAWSMIGNHSLQTATLASPAGVKPRFQYVLKLCFVRDTEMDSFSPDLLSSWPKAQDGSAGSGSSPSAAGNPDSLDDTVFLSEGLKNRLSKLQKKS